MSAEGGAATDRRARLPVRKLRRIIHSAYVHLLFVVVVVISRYGHGFEMFCLASDSARTVVASACKVSVIRPRRPALPDTTVTVRI